MPSRSKYSQCMAVSALVATSLLGCASSKNVASTESNYPQDNPSPKHTIHMHGSVPKELSLRFDVFWETDYKNKKQCRYYDNGYARFEGVPTPFHVVQYLPITRSGESFEANVVVDKYMPGECNWRLGSVMYEVSRGNGKPSRWQIIGQPDGYLDEIGPITIWCKRTQNSTEVTDMYCGYWNEALRGKVQRAWMRLSPGVDDLEVNFRVLD